MRNAWKTTALSFAIVLLSPATPATATKGVVPDNNTSPVSSQHSLQAALVESKASDIEIRLDFHPFTSDKSSFLILRGDGNARAIRYYRSQLTVVAAYQGTVSEKSLAGLLNSTRAPAFKEALRRRDFSGEGLSRGDQFHLSFETRADAVKEIFGFVSDTPAVVRDLIEGLLHLETQLTKVSLADAYVQSKPIDANRFITLRKDKALRFSSVHELPSDLQPIVAAAIIRPHSFHALTQVDYDRLLTWSLHAYEVFVADNGSGYQLTLFKSAKPSAGADKKGDK